MDKVTPDVMVREKLNAYYFSFNPTGNADIDRILGAIAYAGKAYHHTEDWESDDVLSVSCVDNIQNAANLAAANLATPAPDSEKLREAAERLVRLLNERCKGGFTWSPLMPGETIRVALDDTRAALGASL